jgi:hypothetical protein
MQMLMTGWFSGTGVEGRTSGHAQVGLDPYIDPDSLTLFSFSVKVNSLESERGPRRAAEIASATGHPSNTAILPECEAMGCRGAERRGRLSQTAVHLGKLT